MGCHSNPSSFSRRTMSSNVDGQQQDLIALGSICSICTEEMVAASSSNANDDDDDIKVPLPVKASNGELINRLPCNHDFHDHCLMLWLLKSNTCPNCRRDLPLEFPVESVLTRLSLRLRFLLKKRMFKPSSYTFFMIKAFFHLLEQNPAANSGPRFLVRAMRELQAFTTTPSCDIGEGTHWFRPRCCAVCSEELYYVPPNGVYTCALCRCQFPKDISIECVLKHLIRVLRSQNLESLGSVCPLFECILWLLVRDEKNSRHAQPFLGRVIQRFDKLIDGMH